ncbi:CHAT domain-containing protein [Mycena maculata]|uniref:CHAT domain-containing protein n=1 Tax=Mycena maculata TaxID=230809 RepID=A0AAD7IA23_9AGAR|nr:CHAT domain-containing protein [Mycena maculata]
MFLQHRSRLIKQSQPIFALLLRHNPTPNVDLEEEASSCFNLAHDLLNECKAAGNINDLNTAIFLFLQAAYSLLPAHPELLGSLNRLSGALVIRFSYTGDLEDVYAAATLAGAAAVGYDDIQTLLSMLTDPLTIEDVPGDMMELASDILTHFNQAVDLGTLNNSIFLHREALAFWVGHPEHWKSLLELSEALLIQFRVAGDMEALQEAVSLLRDHHLIQPNRWASLCVALIMEGTQTSNHLWMQEFRALGQKAMESDKKAIALGISGTNLLQVFQQSGNPTDPDASIALLKEGQFQLSWGQQNRGTSLNNLAIAVLTRFEQQGDAQDINEAIQLYQEALTLYPSPHPDRGSSLNNLARAFQTRFQWQGDAQDFDEAIQLHQEALALCPSPHPDCASSLNNLANAAQTRFEQQGDAQDLDEAIHLRREVLALCPSPHHNHGNSLNNLAIAVETRFQQRGDAQDLDEAIQLHQEALALCPSPHPDRGGSLNNLANALVTRSEQQGDAQDLDEAIQLHREALTLHPSPHLNHGTSLNNLAIAVHTRFKQRGDARDIDETIQLHRKALTLRPSPHPDRGSSLNNLANAAETRFEQWGDAQDLDEAIHLHREALALFPSPHPNRRNPLNNLAIAVETRFQQRGDAQDLDEAIQLHQEALALCPSPHPRRGSSLSNLAIAVQTRFEQRGNAQDLDKAIQLLQEALALHSSPHPDCGGFLSNLANALKTRFEQQGDAQDLDKAIQLLHEALALHSSPHPHRAGYLSNLANALKTRFEQQGDAQDLDKAIQLLQEALELHSSPHPHRCSFLSNLAILLVHSYEHGKDPNHLNDALVLLQEASLHLSSSLRTRFQKTHFWARTAASYHHPSALPAYCEAINLLPQLAALHLDLRFRQQLLTTLKGTDLVSGAAVCAVGLAQYTTAVEFLEASRSVFWSQALHLRTPLNRLESSHPDLASRIAALARELEQASFRETRRNLSPDTQDNAISIELEGARCHRLNRDWDEAINSVQMLPGFEDFMRPKGIMALKRAAVHGPIAILNAGKSSGHALLVTPLGEVQCVPLPHISQPSVIWLVKILQALSGSTFDIVEFITKHSRGENTTDWAFMEARLLGGPEVLDPTSNNAFQGLLGILWEVIVKPIIDALNLKKSPNPSRLWWCPVGPLSFLPIHAAGIYDKHGDDCISNYVISSYTPTLTALLDPPTHSEAQFKMTAVIQPESKFSPLPGTRTELKWIRERVPEQWLTALGDTTPATVATALAHLRESSIVHFACHGTQDEFNPLDSGLVLTDGRLKVSEIMHQPDGSEGIRKSMALAFLSACETAKGDDQVPDEAMHLAATLLFAGFRGVVATMWTMNDLDGPKIADTFYKHLFQNCDPTANPPVVPDLTEAACALHLAVAKLREEPDIPFMRWVPFVHYGL